MNIGSEAEVLAQRRFRELVEQLGREAGEAHGWKTAAAKRLGISLPHLSRILISERRAGSRLMARAAAEYGFALAYFTSDHGAYRDFPLPTFASAVAGDPEIAAMQALAALTPEAARRVLRWGAWRFGGES